ncbi:MAG: hypothetical protein FJX74_16235 [Armatimonadetes bacterium]|nr:hypothetical protein [Armatimonadota bacterium]
MRPKRLTDPREILQLEPGYVYGVRLRLVPKRKGLLGARYYSLVYPPATEVDQKFFLEAAGDYSLTVTYQAADDGHAAGVAAWVGSVDSNAVPFSISP